MGHVLSMETIRDRYRGEWVLIAYTELDDQMQVVRGEVLAHSHDRDEIYRRLLEFKGRQLAVEYVGEVPKDLAVLL
jgi:hypothetical protein